MPFLGVLFVHKKPKLKILFYSRNSKKLFVLIALTTVLAILLAIFPYNAIRLAISQSNDYTFESKTIVIDAGHGGIDPGALGINGSKEKDINLEIAVALKDILTVNGYKVVMTRESDISLHDENAKSIHQIKASDLKKRLKIIEENSGAIVVMIHQNHFPEEKYYGAQMFYGRLNEKSEVLAKSVMESFQENIQPNNTRSIKRSTKSVYVLHNAKSPTVMVECGFISNYKEAALLSDSEYQKKLAFTIFCGIEKYRTGSIAF